MQPSKSVTVIVALSLIFMLSFADSLLNPRIEGNSKQSKHDLFKGDQQSFKSNNDESNQIHHNEIDQRIHVSEPFRSLLQSTIRFALAQTRISNHINIDTAMEFINNLGYMLSKPSTLITLVEATAVTIVSLLGATLFFPGFYKFLESAWMDPINALNLDSYISNGVMERSMFGVIGSTTDEALSRVGLQDGSCRERSICYMGEMIKCTFPETSETMARFASENFSGTSYTDNRYIKAFVSGFHDRNCTKVAFSSDQAEPKNCLSNFINSILIPRSSSESGRSPKKYQNMQPARA